MKQVTKQVEPAAFTDWKAKANEDWQPSYDSLQNPEKQILHEALLNEQSRVCCYCGGSISLADSHIEHFRPQEAREDLALDYRNLHASCIRETLPGTPLHCGHAKDRVFDEHLAISPQDANCERRFIYSSQDGAIYPTNKEDASAVYMTKLLQLDIGFLRGRRASALKAVFDEAFLNSTNADELVRLATAYRAHDANGRMTNFGHVLSRYAEQLIGGHI